VLVERLREAEPFAAVKVKLGGPEDEAALRAVRAATDKPLRVDANEGWDVERALHAVALCAEMGVEMIEQPLPAGRLEETARLRERSSVPLFADEDFLTAEDAARLEGVYDGVNVKLLKCGGIGPAREAIAAARAHGLRVLIGCGIESSVGIAAAVALSPLADFADLDGAILTANDPAAGLRLVGGRLLPGPGIGLGVALRDEDLARALGVAGGRSREVEGDAH
jgi:L-alanine-DL-glutamate epimerase-like enolase superfamily enzyme